MFELTGIPGQDGSLGNIWCSSWANVAAGMLLLFQEGGCVGGRWYNDQAATFHTKYTLGCSVQPISFSTM